MIGAVIRWSIANRFIVALFAIVLGASGIWALRTTPVDAIPDLSEVQVIVRTPYAGQAPQVIEDQAVREWVAARNQFAILYPERFNK